MLYLRDLLIPFFHLFTRLLTLAAHKLLTLAAQDYSIPLHKITQSRCTRLLNPAAHKLLTLAVHTNYSLLLHKITQSRCTQITQPIQLPPFLFFLSFCTPLQEYTGGDVLTVFFTVIMGAFALGQAGPSFEAISKGQGTENSPIYPPSIFLSIPSFPIAIPSFSFLPSS